MSGDDDKPFEMPKWHQLPSDPDWAILRQALTRHPLLVVRAARMLVRKQRGYGTTTQEGYAVLWAISPAVQAALKLGLVGPALVERVASHVRQHGVQWPEVKP